MLAAWALDASSDQLFSASILPWHSGPWELFQLEMAAPSILHFMARLSSVTSSGRQPLSAPAALSVSPAQHALLQGEVTSV